MDVEDLSPVTQDYLKVIWQATEWSADPVTTKALAERLSVSPSTVSEAVGRLASAGLVLHEPYAAVELSEAGEALALAMVRRHRLLETYLVKELGYTWDEVHDEAERLEHAVSSQLIDRIDARLGHPTRDPHGDRIPSVSGKLPALKSVRLTELALGHRAQIARISDAEASMLRYFTSVGLHLDQELTVVARREFAGVVTIETSDEDQLSLAEREAQLIWVTPHDVD